MSTTDTAIETQEFQVSTHAPAPTVPDAIATAVKACEEARLQVVAVDERIQKLEGEKKAEIATVEAKFAGRLEEHQKSRKPLEKELQSKKAALAKLTESRYGAATEKKPAKKSAKKSSKRGTRAAPGAVREAILDAVPPGETVSKTDIVTAVEKKGLSSGAVGVTLTSLKKSGDLKSTGRGLYTR